MLKNKKQRRLGDSYNQARLKPDSRRKKPRWFPCICCGIISRSFCQYTDLCVFACESWGFRTWRIPCRSLGTDKETASRPCERERDWQVCISLWTACWYVHIRASNTSDPSAPLRRHDPLSDALPAPSLTWNDVRIPSLLNLRPSVHSHASIITTLFKFFFSFIAARCYMHKRGLCRHAVSVCMSVTFVSCVKTNKHIIKIFHHRVATPVFPCQTA